MAFVKLDTGILNSTLWIERDQRELFITALLMAEPREFQNPTRQIKIGVLEWGDFEAPPGWYGFVPAASVGIIRRAGVDAEPGMEALRKLGEPEPESRSKEFEGRRMIRVDGGFLILNYMKYRDKDHTAAERQQRLRDRRKVLRSVTSRRDDAQSQRDVALQSRNITDADADADAYKEPPPKKRRSVGADGELMAASHLLEELNVVGRSSLMHVASEAIHSLASEGGNVETACTFILQAGKQAQVAGEVINRFWFTDQKYKPQVEKRSKTAIPTPAPTPTKDARQREDEEAKLMWDGMSEKYKTENPWVGA